MSSEILSSVSTESAESSKLISISRGASSSIISSSFCASTGADSKEPPSIKSSRESSSVSEAGISG